MVSVNKEDMKIKIGYEQDGWKVKKDQEDKNERRDPTSFLPEEPMSYEIKQKKKKKKKKKQEDPFKDIELGPQNYVIEPSLELNLDPEVNIKVEDIEVNLDFNDFANSGLMVEGHHSEDSQEPIVKLEEENKEATLLTFESIVNNHSILGVTEDKNIEPAQIYTEIIPPTEDIAPTNMCPICHLVFKSKKTLRIHQKRKHKVYRQSFKHVCDNCGMSYESKNSLIAHMKRKHGPNAIPEDHEDRTCDVCALVFRGMHRLRMHMTRKHGLLKDAFKHVCKVCGLTYDKYSSLIVHIQRKHTRSKPIETKWYKCPFCAVIFSKRETYARHVQRKHHVSEKEAKKNELSINLEEFKNEKSGEVSCKECPLVFSSLGYLKLHMRRKHNALKEDFRLKCSICNLSYNKIESLKRHVRRKHDQGSHCDVCNKQFDTRESYLNHSHSNEYKECSLCGLIFATQGGLAKHLRCTHKMDSPKVAHCNICNQGFHDKRLLKPHIMKVHLKVSYTCKYCKKVFKARESYRRHVMIKHPDKQLVKQKQQCEQCPKMFDDEFEMSKHICLAHGKNEGLNLEAPEVKKEDADIKNNFQCTKCSDIYPSFETLKIHFELNHVSNETQCQMCGEMVPAPELQKHIKSLHMEITVQCKYCEFQTNNKTSMTQHVLRHKNATTLHCDVAGCRYKSYYEGAMLKHKQKHKELGSVKLQCSKCPFQSMNKYILRYHEEAHETGKKRYKCDQCDYATILPANLVQHKYKHSTVKRFKCEVCPFASKYNTSLRFHVKTKHCDLPSFG